MNYNRFSAIIGGLMILGMLAASAHGARVAIIPGMTVEEWKAAENDNYVELYGKLTQDVTTSGNPSFLSIHASGGNLAAANAQVTKKWISTLGYTADVTSVIHGGEHYICTTSHIADATTEPGVGASWESMWKLATGGGGYTNLTEFVGQTAWRFFYSDGLGDVKELALGADGTYLKSNGASSVPSFATPSGTMSWPATAGIAVYGGSSAWGSSLTLDTDIITGVSASDDSVASAKATKALYDSLPTLTFGTGLTNTSNTITTTNYIIASGTKTLATAAISANSCATVETATATGTATTDVILATPNARLSTVTGYGVTTAGALRIDVYPTSGTVNFEVCNPTGASITPGAVSVNWKVMR